MKIFDHDIKKTNEREREKQINFLKGFISLLVEKLIWNLEKSELVLGCYGNISDGRKAAKLLTQCEIEFDSNTEIYRIPMRMKTLAEKLDAFYETNEFFTIYKIKLGIEKQEIAELITKMKEEDSDKCSLPLEDHMEPEEYDRIINKINKLDFPSWETKHNPERVVINAALQEVVATVEKQYREAVEESAAYRGYGL